MPSSDKYDLKYGQKVEITTVEGAMLVGLFERQTQTRLEIANVIDLNTETKSLFKFIAKSEIADIHQVTSEVDEMRPKKIQSHLSPEKLRQIEKTIENFVMIKCYDMKFKEAITDIASKTLIGVAVGTSHKNNYHIAISTDDRVYIFDMICLAERHIKQVKKELSAILTSKCITKVVHDTESTCAKLVELHQLEMTTTFDLMTAAASQYWPMEVLKHFDSLLISLLAIDKRDVMFQLPTADELAINAAFHLPMHQKLTSAWYAKLFKNFDTSKKQFLVPNSDETHLETFQNNLTELTNKIQNINA